jgi:hypothetical protein
MVAVTTPALFCFAPVRRAVVLYGSMLFSEEFLVPKYQKVQENE